MHEKKTGGTWVTRIDFSFAFRTHKNGAMWIDKIRLNA